MRRFSSLLMALMVTVLLWGNCAQCSVIAQSDSQAASHDCCPKPQNGKPLKQNCDLNAADLSKATYADQHHSEQPLAIVGAVVDVAVPPALSSAAAVEPVASPPAEFCLLYSVFRL